MNYLKILKSTNKQDLLFIKGPLIILGIFFLVGIFLFPKPSRIYKDYVLKECRCFGIKAAPRVTKGSVVGDEYCLGIPFSCTEQKLVEDQEGVRENE